jgi:hypothetical protein
MALSPSSGGCSGVKPIQLGPVERANRTRWSRLARSIGPNWIGFTSLYPPEDRDRASLRNVVFYRINRTMDVVHKHSSLVHHVPSSKSFQVYPQLCCMSSIVRAKSDTLTHSSRPIKVVCITRWHAVLRTYFVRDTGKNWKHMRNSPNVRIIMIDHRSLNQWKCSICDSVIYREYSTMIGVIAIANHLKITVQITSATPHQSMGKVGIGHNWNNFANPLTATRVAAYKPSALLFLTVATSAMRGASFLLVSVKPSRNDSSHHFPGVFRSVSL